MKPERNIVWLKRDLRSSDQHALAAAESAGKPYFCVFIFEPSMLALPDCSLRHLQFQFQSLQQLQKSWSHAEGGIFIGHTDAQTCFDHLLEHYHISSIFAYQESGIPETFARDRSVRAYFKEKGIVFKEFQKDGVQRGILNRDGWDQAWLEAISAPLIRNTFKHLVAPNASPFSLPDKLYDEIKLYPSAYQPAGTGAGFRYLESFLEERHRFYIKNISKPGTEGRRSSGRISPYLAWGNLSTRQVWHRLQVELEKGKNRNIQAFRQRLKWRDHFIQKFEVECRMAKEPVNRGYEEVYSDLNPEFLLAWEKGQTGFPMIDAAMRSLEATGWLPFRMRSMLASFLCHYLGIDWRHGVHHLARLFLDYEPGIHFPQMQMQAGVTGTNLIRMYNPVKQSYDQDADGQFIRTWVPELNSIGAPAIHEPWLVRANLFDEGKPKLYPDPIVSPLGPNKMVKEHLWALRKDALVRKENVRILRMHAR
jgi:deoxyribodipyrimidine photo-lyase